MFPDHENKNPWNEIHCSLETESQKHHINDACKLLKEGSQNILSKVEEAVIESFAEKAAEFYKLERQLLSKYEYVMEMFPFVKCKKRDSTSAIISFFIPKMLIERTELENLLRKYKTLWKELAPLAAEICRPLYAKHKNVDKKVVSFPLLPRSD